MSRSRRLAGLATALLLVDSPVRASVHIRPPDSGIDLTAMGFAVLQTNFSEHLEGFFDSSDQYPADFANRSVLNLRQRPCHLTLTLSLVRMTKATLSPSSRSKSATSAKPRSAVKMHK